MLAILALDLQEPAVGFTPMTRCYFFHYTEPLHFSGLEMALLALLIAMSTAMFAYRLSPIALNIWRAKKDPAHTLAPLHKRAWAFFWEGVCQAKVI